MGIDTVRLLQSLKLSIRLAVLGLAGLSIFILAETWEIVCLEWGIAGKRSGSLSAGVITTKYSSPETAVPKDAAGMNGAAILPAGTSAQQPAAPVDGMFRFNADNDAFEGYGQNLTAWEPLMPTGASTDKVVYLNEQIVTTDYTLPAAPIIKNGLSAGPITVAAGVTVTVPAGQAWSIV